MFLNHLEGAGSSSVQRFWIKASEESRFPTQNWEIFFFLYIMLNEVMIWVFALQMSVSWFKVGPRCHAAFPVVLLVSCFTYSPTSYCDSALVKGVGFFLFVTPASVSHLLGPLQLNPVMITDMLTWKMENKCRIDHLPSIILEKKQHWVFHRCWWLNSQVATLNSQTYLSKWKTQEKPSNLKIRLFFHLCMYEELLQAKKKTI